MNTFKSFITGIWRHIRDIVKSTYSDIKKRITKEKTREDTMFEEYMKVQYDLLLSIPQEYEIEPDILSPIQEIQRNDHNILYTDMPGILRNSRAWGHDKGTTMYKVWYGRWDSEINLEELLLTEDIYAPDSEGHTLYDMISAILIVNGERIATAEDGSLYITDY